MSQQTKAPRLREAIDRYRAKHSEELDEYADRLLERLARSPEAAKAFERLTPKEESEAAIREAAIVRARQSDRTRAFLKRLKKGNPQLARALERQLKPTDHAKAVDGQAAMIRAWIEAENLARSSSKLVKKAKQRLNRRRTERLGNAATTLRGLFK